MKPWILAAVAAALILLTVRMTRRPKPGGEGFVPATPDTIKSSLAGIVRDYGRAIAENVERIYRLETRDFKSAQFIATNTAGQVAVDPSFPFGWSPRGTKASDYVEPVMMPENQTGADTLFVAFKQFDKAARFLAQVMKERGNDPGKWKTLSGSASYRNAVAQVEPSIVNTL